MRQYYRIFRHARQKMAKIVRVVDGDQLFSGCGLGLRQCSEAHPCPIHEEFKKIREDITMLLEQAHLEEFTDRLEENLLFPGALEMAEKDHR